MALTAYLDSSDYSALSDPSRRTEATEQTRHALIALARSGRVRFAFSGTHLSEMAPLAPQFVPSAAARADLLVELCGRVALISFDRLLSMELLQLRDESAPRVEAITEDATWFPEMQDLLEGPVQFAAGIRKAINEEVTKQGLNSQQRRQLMQRLFRGDEPRPLLRQFITKFAAEGDMSQMLELYPMRPADMRVLWRYVIGRARADEAERAFLESLRDPSWMIRWFERHHEKLSPLTDWVRGPSRAFVAQLAAVVAQGRELAPYPAAVRGNVLSSAWWHARENQTLIELANRQLLREWPESKACDDTDRIDRSCPGFATAVRLCFALLRDSMSQQPRNLRESDFVDALHAMYAPYVDVFRADRYIAPHLARLIRPWGTTVVARLEEMPTAIEGRLAGP